MLADIPQMTGDLTVAFARVGLFGKGTSKNIRLRRDDRRLRSQRCRFNVRRPFIEDRRRRLPGPPAGFLELLRPLRLVGGPQDKRRSATRRRARRADGSHSSHFGFLFVFGGLSRTPCPSSRNSTPAFSSAATIFSPVTGLPPRSPPAASRRLMVGIETPDALAIASCDQPSNPRAALICLINTFGIDKRLL